MSTPERERAPHTASSGDVPREEAAMPVHAPVHDPAVIRERNLAMNVVALALLIAVAGSAGLEYLGWQIIRDAHGPTAIPWDDFLVGAVDTLLGALGVGAASVIGTLLFPSTWRRPLRKIPLAFLGGATAFIGFLSWLTLPYFF